MNRLLLQLIACLLAAGGVAAGWSVLNSDAPLATTHHVTLLQPIEQIDYSRWEPLADGWKPDYYALAYVGDQSIEAVRADYEANGTITVGSPLVGVYFDDIRCDSGGDFNPSELPEGTGLRVERNNGRTYDNMSPTIFAADLVEAGC